jgi:hypothetical protein
MSERGGVQDHTDRLTAAWFRCRPKLWLVGVHGDQLFHQAAVLSGIYRLSSSNLRLLFFEYRFTNNVDHTTHFTDDRRGS